MTVSASEGVAYPTVGVSTERFGPPTEIVFIDPRVPHLEDLVAGIAAGVRALVLDRAGSGFAQIEAQLAAHRARGLAGVSIVAHGAPGALSLGAETLRQADLQTHAAALAALGAALAPGGALKLFACDLAAGSAGRAFLATLSRLGGGIDVVAASHPVGAAISGGSWVLDAATGHSAGMAPFTAPTLAAYPGILDNTTLTTSQTTTLKTDVDGDGIADPGDTVTTTVTITNTGSTDASGVSLIEAQNGLTPVAGSLKISPIAIADSYTVVGSSTYQGSSVLANDRSPDHGTLTATGLVESDATTHGTVTLNSDGTFTYVADTGYVGIATFQYTAHDATGLDSNHKATVTLNVTDHPPVVTAGRTLAYTENQAATAIDGGITVSDPDSATLTGATVKISGNYAAGQDVLALAAQNNITGTFDAGTGTLTLSGADTLAHYQAALRAVTYANTSDDPSAANRTVSIVVNDGTKASAVVTDTITVAPVNDAPVNAVPGAQTVDEDTNLVFGAATGNAIAISDVDAEGGSETVTLSVRHGTLTLGSSANLTMVTDNAASISLTGTVAAVDAALDGLTYRGAQDYDGADTLSITTTDNGHTGSGGALNASGSVSITVNPVNDAPTATNLTQSLTIDEDAAAATLFTTAPVVSDVDSTNVTATLTIAASAGVLDNAGAATISGGNLVYTITGTTSAVNAALANVTYDSAQDFNGSASVAVAIDDGQNGPQGSNPTGAVSITVNPVNDAPSFTLSSNTTTSAEDAGAQTVAGFATMISPGPTNESGQTVSFVVDSDTNAGLFATGGGPAIDANGNLTYTAAANANGMATITVHAMDNGGKDHGGVDSSPGQTFTITVNPVNDAPTATGLNQSLTIDEDAAATTLFTTAPTVSDIDSATVTATLTISAAAGVLTGAGTATTSGGNLVYKITDTPAAVSSALAAVKYDSADNYNGSVSVTVAIDDGQSGPQGTNPTGTVSITVNAVDDSPMNHVPGAQMVAEDTSLVFGTGTGNAITVSDIDANGGDETVTLTVWDGTLTLGSTTNLTSFTNNAVSISLTGSVADLNAALDGLTYRGTQDFNGTDKLTVTVNDNGHTGSGGPLTGTDLVGITVTAVNDAPVNHVPSAQTVNEDLALVFSAAAANAITVSDVDANGGDETVTLTVSHGTLTVGQGGAPTSISNNGTSSVTVIGSISNINAALDGLTYRGASNYNGMDALAVTTSDNGHSGSGGTMTDADTVAITVNSVNDAPAGTDKTISGAGQHVFTAADFGFTDPADAAGPSGANALLAVEITTLPTSGALTDNGTAVTADEFIPVADITGGKLIFTPSGGPETATFTFQVQDDGGTDNGGQDTDQSPNTITLSPNTPPIARDDNLTATEKGGTGNNSGGHDPQGNVVTATGGNGPNGEVADSDNEDAATALVVVKAGTGASPGGGDAGVTSTGTAIVGSHGTLTIKSDGSYTYAVNQGDSAVNALNTAQSLSDTFHYTIQDTGGLQSSAAINVTIHGANDAPTPHADSVSATEAGGVSNGTPGTNPSFNVIAGAGETITSGADTDPDAGDTATLRVAGVAAGTIPDALTSGAGSDVAGFFGTIHINADGTSTYTVNNSNPTVQGLRTFNDVQTDTFTYTVKDAGNPALTANTQVTVTIHGQNDAPTANADTSADSGAAAALEAGGTSNGTAGHAGTGNVLNNDSDPDFGDTKTVQGVAAGAVVGTQTGNVGSGVNGQYGTLTLNASGSYTYVVTDANSTVQALNTNSTPLTDTFTYTMHDTAGATSTTTLTVSIQGANDAPVAANGTASGDEDQPDANHAGPITVALSASDVDDTTGQTYKLSSLPSNGTLYTDSAETVAANTTTAYTSNTFYFKPTANYSGTGTFQFTSTDQHNAVSNTATETIDVAPVADPPTLTVGSLQPTPATAETSYSPSYGSNGGSVVSAIAGGYVVAYENFNDLGNSADYSGEIDAIRYNNSGVALDSTPIRVTTSVPGPYADTLPDVQKLANGGFLVTWERSLDPSYPEDTSIMGRIYGSNGVAAGNAFTIEDDSSSAQPQLEYPSTAVLSDGTFITFYEKAAIPESNVDIYARHMSATGTPIGAAFEVPTTTANDQLFPKVTTLSDGGFLVVWETNVGTSSNANVDIHAQRYAYDPVHGAITPVYANGSSTGTGSMEFAINAQTSGAQDIPVVAGLAGGGWVSAWRTAVSGQDQIVARVFSATGVGGAEFAVNTTTTTSQNDPSIVALPDGGFVVSWQHVVVGGDAGDIYAQRFDASGQTIGTTEYAVNNTGTSGQQN